MLKQKIKEDLKTALKEGKETELSTLRMVLAAISNKEIDKKYKEKIEGEAELTEEEVLAVISSEAKKRKEAAQEFEKGNRQDLADKEKREFKVLQKYLPEQISEEEIRKIVKAAIEKTGASSPKDMGKIMAEVMPKVKGRADGSEINRIAKELLS